MGHASNVVHCTGPDDPHALDLIAVQPRNGMLDAQCPKCHGRGEWNAEIDLVSFRCKRTICDRCYGQGWVETGSDPIGFPDIERGPGGHPRWVTRFVPRADLDQNQPAGPLAIDPGDS